MSMIKLSGNDVVDIEGKTFTVSELKEHVIDSILYRKHLTDLMRMEESE